ncbi:NADH dehydrogenase [ubiquinone] 1 alpha subcomplex subunit 3 isoform X2 [Saimiri boliviensis]|uniref:NADH dehydrogenase [ubiquinone] 1 alpha subcomplex subunit 3 isoform X2 n=1 Tax=Saimiri boliviensis TaxID=27679 RepID=UPI003D789198
MERTVQPRVPASLPLRLEVFWGCSAPGLRGGRQQRDHNSQSAPRPGFRLHFCSRAHAQPLAASRAETTTPRVLSVVVAAAETKMAARLRAFLKNAWDKEPVLVVSFCIGTLAVILPPISPYFKYSVMINKATPYNYPVPVRDDGNMPDIPSHPQDPQGPSLEWLKTL